MIKGMILISISKHSNSLGKVVKLMKAMKPQAPRLLALLAALLMAIPLAACGGDTTPPVSGGAQTGASAGPGGPSGGTGVSNSAEASGYTGESAGVVVTDPSGNPITGDRTVSAGGTSPGGVVKPGETNARTTAGKGNVNPGTPGGTTATKGGDLTPTAPPADQGKGVTIWGSETNVSLQLGIEAYKAKYPDVPIERKTTPSGDLLNTLKTAIAAKDSPDVVEMDHVYLTSLGMEGYMYNLADFGADKDVLSQFTPATIDACSYEGKVYGLPISANVVGNYYNKNLINIYNQGKVPSTFEEMIALGNTLNGVGKKLYSFPFSGDAGGGGKNWATFNFCFWLWSEGGELLTQNSKGQWEAAFNSEAGLEALRKLKQLKPYMTDQYTDGITDDVAMISMGSWKIASASGSNAKAGVSAMPSTGPAGGYSLLGCYAYGVPVGGSGNKQDAYNFIETITTNVQCQVRRNTSSPDMPQIPPLIAAQKDKFYTTGDTAEVWQVFFKQMDTVNFRPPIAGWSDIEGYLADAVMGAVVMNQDEKSMLDAAAQKANSKLRAIYKY